MTAESTLIHSRRNCLSGFCAWHNPSDHHMKDWPKSIRMDRADRLTERLCAHGIGHPDPDTLVYLETFTKYKMSGVHGCDGCCVIRNEKEGEQ